MSVILSVGFFIHLLNDTEAHRSDAKIIPTCSAFEAPRVRATAAIVFDMNTGTALYEKSAFDQMPLASLTKIMTVLAARKTRNPDDIVTVGSAALEPEGDSGFWAGETWRFQELVDYTLITSSNDGARALALSALNPRETLDDFIERMNAMARSLGLTQTYFLNDTGLDTSPTVAGAYGSAYDVALLLTHILREHEETFSHSAESEQTFTTPSGKTYHARHTNATVGSFPGEVVVKTGFTDLAGGNLAVAIEPSPGHPLALVVLGSTREARAEDIAILALWAKNRLKHATLCAPSPSWTPHF